MQVIFNKKQMKQVRFHQEEEIVFIRFFHKLKQKQYCQPFKKDIKLQAMQNQVPEILHPVKLGCTNFKQS